MSRRGSTQLLLLSFRSRRGLRRTLGVAAAVALLAGVSQSARDFPLLTQTGVAQMLRQSAWERALAGLPEHTPWPWLETPSPAASSVPRLGLSASLLAAKRPEPPADRPAKPAKPADPAQDPHLGQFGEVGIGDQITVTTASGASRVYRITGPKVVDPHLAETAPDAPQPDRPHCLPLDPLLAGSLLVIQAGQAELQATPEPAPERKL